MTAFPPTTYATPPAPTVSGGRRPFQYSLARYHAAIDAGILTENDKVELIFGEIIEQLPIGRRHRICVDIINEFFVTRFAGRCKCSSQSPITLLGNSEPEPDYLLLDKDSYARRPRHPLAEDVHLLIEVSDSTLDYDRTTKLKMYALAGIQEYWIINLKQDQIEVHLSVVTQTGEYDDIQRYHRGVTFQSPFCGSMSVDELLPPPQNEAE